MDTDYSKLPTLENIYLEDSWVLELNESADSISFTLDAVLTETHPEYTLPKAGEQYCYRHAVLNFAGVTDFRWQKKDLDNVTTDATGSSDHGNIDVLGITHDGYYIEGQFGELEVATGTPPKLTLSS